MTDWKVVGPLFFLLWFVTVCFCIWFLNKDDDDDFDNCDPA